MGKTRFLKISNSLLELEKDFTELSDRELKYVEVKIKREIQELFFKPIIMSIDFLFYQGFLSQTLMIHRTAWEGRGLSFIPLYHFHPLTNIETFICNFACEMTITYF